MSWTFLIILCVVISLVLGPIMMLRPSPRQKKQEALRILARSLGMQITFRRLPPVPGDLEAAINPIAVYFLPPIETLTQKDWLLVRANYQHELHLMGNWTWSGSERASDGELIHILEFLKDVPSEVKGVSGGRSGFSVYWTEEGDEDVVQRIGHFLSALQSTTYAEPVKEVK